jgi:hypothetical protein
MRELALRQAEGRLEVFGKDLLLLHGSNNDFVDLFLSCGLCFWERLLRFGLAVLKELSLRRG